MDRVHKNLKLKKIFALLFALAVILTVPFSVQAKKAEEKVVRVGWFDSTYNSFDESGRRSGYSYEYQQKLSAYNGWKYEYVDGSWSDLFQMLVDGEIDIMSDISYTKERSKKILYPSLPMGSEEYYLFTAVGYNEITDYKSLNGKRIAVNKDSYQEELYRKWAKDNNIKAKEVLVTTTEDESLKMMEDGKIDAYVTVDSFMDPSRAVPKFKIGSSDYYFAVRKDRPDLLEDLNYAMSKIQDENRYYNQQMFEKYISRSGANAFFTDDEIAWLKNHQTVRVGYQDNYMAFCAEDKNGELTGVLKDYLNKASDCVPNAHIEFAPKSYPTAQAALDALKNDEVDCVFPANLSGYESENEGVVMTPSIINTEMYAVVKNGASNIFTKKGIVTAAVNKGNPNYEAFLAEQFPDWGKVMFDDTEACLKGISKDKADCLIISNYRLNNISRLCTKYHLTSVSLGRHMDYCFAVKKGDVDLYSILAKTTSMIPASVINASITNYATEDSRPTFKDYISENMPIAFGVTAIIALIILALLIQNIRAVKKARKLISATETDDLTGLYNRKYFFQYAERMFSEHSGTPMDAIVLNIEQFHSINELHGRSVGDRVLRILGNEIHEIAKENNGIGGRFEADRFDIFCSPIDDYKAVFNRIQSKLDELPYKMDIRLRMGVMPWQEGLELVQLFDRARTACNMARGSFGEHMIIYDEAVSNREKYEQRLVNDLRHALDAKEFVVYYQPKFDIQSEPARIVSAEALVRWNHSEFGLIAPDDFIPLFEKNGQIGLIDRYVWSEVAKQIALWKKKYGIVIPVSVNLSRVDVFDANLTDTLDEILSGCNLEHEAFKLEVTESAYIENTEQVIAVVKELRNIGYKFEMDDFGTGYSSLNMLSEMPIDGLKMDRAFVRNIEKDKKQDYMIALILDIAKNLNVPVIAEGVETEYQLNLLKKLGCEMVQGYYFSRPIPADEFEKKYFNDEKNED